MAPSQAEDARRGGGESSASPGKRRSRRRLLKTLALSAPAGIIGGALTQTLVGVKHSSASALPGPAGEETDALRRTYWQRALDERATAGGAVAVADPPSPALPLPLLSPPGELAGSAAVASPAAIPVNTLGEAAVVRMQRDLKRAMEKPISQRKWAMAIDLQKCIGCSACTVACKAENHLPPGVVYRPVIEEEIGEYPNVSRRWLPRPCQQCEDPPCVDVCPVGATWKREDGIVVINYKTCIGCRYCITACPYGARYFDFGDNYSDSTPAEQPYEKSPAPEYGRTWPRNDDSPVGNARKCQFCVHRLNAGMLPACVTTCIGGATFFGDKNDPEALISELIASPRVKRLKEEMGTNPKVYYLT